MSTYNLTKNLQTWLHECSFPPKQTWKKIVRSAVSKLHQTNRNIRMINNNDFYRFQSIIQNQNPYVSSGLFRLNQSKSLFVYLYASLYSLSSVTDSLYLQTMQHRVPWHFSTYLFLPVDRWLTNVRTYWSRDQITNSFEVHLSADLCAMTNDDNYIFLPSTGIKYFTWLPDKRSACTL